MTRYDNVGMQFSKVASIIPEAESIVINQMVYDLERHGYDIVTLSLGEAFFDIPLFDMKALDLSKAYHYSDSRGLLELRHKIAEYYTNYYNAAVDGEREVLISAGSKAIIFMAMMVVLNPGDEVLIHEPAWLSYQEQARLAHAEPAFIPFECRPEDFAQHLGRNTKMLILNNPNNPVGRLYTREELTFVYDLCRSRGIYLLIDEAYSDFVLSEGFVSLAEIAPEKHGAIIVNSLSKNMGMSGWRIGYAISSPAFIDTLLKINQHIITCAPTILLQYCAKYFDRLIGITLPQVALVVERRQCVGKMLDDLKMDHLPGGATFYFFVSIGNFPGTSREFAQWLLLDKHIAVVPGSAYGESTGRFVRLSVGAETEERIWEALHHIKALSEAHEFDRTTLIRRLEKYRATGGR